MVNMKGVLFGFLIALMTMGIFVSVGCCGGGAKGMPMLERVPSDASRVRYFDTGLLRSWPELRDRMVKDELEDQGIIAAEALTGIKLDDEHLEALTRVMTSSGQEADIYEGRFDLDAVRGRLKEAKCEQGEYQGVELWHFNLNLDVYVYEAWVAVTEEAVVVGGEDGVTDCIEVMKGYKKSLGSGGDLVVVMDRLPSEVYMLDVQTQDEENEGVEVGGYAISRMDADTLKLTYAYKFKDEQAAGEGRDKIKASIDQDPYWFTLTVRQEKEFVEATAKMGTEDYINSTG
jgi:hypothetical protein